MKVDKPAEILHLPLIQEIASGKGQHSEKINEQSA